MRVARNILALLVNQVGTWLVTLALTLVLPRYLGPSSYGVYSFAAGFVGFFALGMQLGTNKYLTWRIAREPELASSLTFNTLFLQLPLAIACGGAALIILPLIDNTDPALTQLVLIVVVSNAIASFTGTLIAALAGFQNMRVPALITLLSSTVVAALIILGTWVNVTLIGLAVIGLGGEVLSLASMIIYAGVKLRLRPSLDPTLWRAILVGGMPFFAWAVVLTFYWQIDVSMLKILVPSAMANEVVGWYASANRLVSIPIFLPTIVIAAILPALSHERSADSPRFREMASRSLRLVSLVAIPASVGVVLLADQLATLLKYPSAFHPLVLLLQILSINIPLVAIDMVLGTVLIAMGRQKAWTLVGVAAAFFNPLVNLWAIPYTQQLYGNGAIGAAVVTVLTEFVMFFGALLLRPKSVFTRADVAYVLRCLLATAIMIPAVLLLSQIATVGIFAAAAYGALIYATAAYSLKLIADDELGQLRRLVSARMNKGAAIAATTGIQATAPSLAAVSVSAHTSPMRSLGQWNMRQMITDAAVPVVSIDPTDESWVSIIYEFDDDLEATAFHETMPFRVVPRQPHNELTPSHTRAHPQHDDQL